MNSIAVKPTRIAEPTNVEKIRRLPFMMAFDAFNAMFCNLSVLGSVFVLFLSDMGMPKDRIGFLLSLVPFCSVVAIFMAPVAARMGVKRVFMTFWGSRNIFAAAVLLTPWIAGRYGTAVAFGFVTIMMACFSMCRSLGEAANYPWRQQLVPNNIRGKFSAIDSVVYTGACVIALGIAGMVLSSSANPNRFLWVMAAGSVLGCTSILWAAMLPGGQAAKNPEPWGTHLVRMVGALRDRNFLLYNLALSLVTFGSAPLGIFVPLFLKEMVGLSDGNIVLLTNGSLVGCLLSSYFWGWASDRYGSKPVILTGLGMLLLPPLGWLAIPCHSAWSVPVAVAISVIGGVASMAYVLGTGRQLYVTIVPPRMKTQYMSIFCAWMGLTGGLGQLLAGASMNIVKDISGTVAGIPVNSYTPLFLFSIVMLLGGLALQRRVEADGSLAAGKFMALFFQGNAVMAVESLVRYNLAPSEAGRLSLINRLGRANSPISADELTDALVDPSFSVRYQAIITIARTRSDSRLTAGLVETLISGQPDLSIAAAWALARVGDRSAIPMLRWAFTSPYPLLRLRSARALATFGDPDIAADVLRAGREEESAPLREAYARVAQSLQTAATPLAASRCEALWRSNRRPRPDVLLDAMQHGTFDEQYQAVILTTRRRGDDRLTQALIGLLAHGEADLSIEAAWALSHTADPSAAAPLRQALAGGGPLLRARSARALAALGETRIIPELTRQLAQECDLGVRIAYASALGQLGARQAVAELLMLQDQMPNGLWQSELNLALARLAGDERYFIRLWRQMRNEPGTRAAQCLQKLLPRIGRLDGEPSHRAKAGIRATLKRTRLGVLAGEDEPGAMLPRSLGKHASANDSSAEAWHPQVTADEPALALAHRCLQALGHEDLPQGSALLADLIYRLDLATLPHVLSAILTDSAARLRDPSPAPARPIPLAMHCLKLALEAPHAAKA